MTRTKLRWCAAICAAALALTACASGPGAPTVTPAHTALPATPTPAATPTATPVPAGASITIAAVGDISLAREVVPRMEANGADYPYALVRDLLASADITIANLEGALTERGDPWPKGYNFRTPPRFASGLRDAGIDLVSLANNHAMDYGAIGLEDTLDALDGAGVVRAGAGRSALEAAAPVYIEAGGMRVAFIGCVATPDEGGGFSIRQWAAGAASAGLSVCDEAALRAWIAEARRQSDFVIVIAHAGTEYVTAPDPTQQRIAQTVIEAGADAYIGHHAHVVQPVELDGRQLVAWGLGNFIFDLDPVDLANIPAPRVSLVLRFTLTKGAGVTSFEALPVVLDDAEDRPRPASPDEAAILQGLIGTP